MQIGCWEGITREVQARVLSVQGEVRIGVGDQSNFQPLDERTTPGAGSVVRTTDSSQLTLALIPGVIAHLSGNSELKIESLRLTKDGEETEEDSMINRVVRVRLNRGTMLVLFQRRSGSRARCAVDTPQSTITADRSALFHIRAENGKTRVTCVGGKVYVTSEDGQSESVDTGLLREWPAPKGARPIPVTDDSQAQIDTEESLKIWEEMQQLQTKAKNKLP